MSNLYNETKLGFQYIFEAHVRQFQKNDEHTVANLRNALKN